VRCRRRRRSGSRAGGVGVFLYPDPPSTLRTSGRSKQPGRCHRVRPRTSGPAGAARACTRGPATREARQGAAPRPSFRATSSNFSPHARSGARAAPTAIAADQRRHRTPVCGAWAQSSGADLQERVRHQGVVAALVGRSSRTPRRRAGSGGEPNHFRMPPRVRRASPIWPAARYPDRTRPRKPRSACGG
jgi:hypothetical protein